MGFGMVVCILVVWVHDFLFVYTVGGDDYNDDHDCGDAVILHSLNLMHPKYYDNEFYPIDIHSPAQLVVTVDSLGRMNEHRDLVDQVINWTVNYMQDTKGYFY